jgi:hypothetical protein
MKPSDSLAQGHCIKAAAAWRTVIGDGLRKIAGDSAWEPSAIDSNLTPVAG